MTSKLIVNNIEADAGVSTITFGSEISASKITTSSGDFTVGTGASVYSPTTNVLALGTNSAERVRITSGGNVIIGDIASDLSGDHTFIACGSKHAFQYDGNTGTYLSVILGSANGTVDIEADARSGNYPDLRFTTTNTERLRITSDGKIGINSTSPLEIVDIVHNAPKINATATNGLSGFRLNVASGYGSQTFRVQEGGTTVFTIQNGGDILIPNGKGIDFSATSDGSGTMSSELLDDYEEGTFTPIIYGGTTTGTATGGTIQGRYIKIGHFVHCSIRINNVTFSGSSGNMIIGGFPYTIASTTNGEYSAVAAAMMYNVTFNTSHKHGWYLNPGTTRADGIVSRSGATWTDWASSEFHSTIYLNQSFSYKAA